MTIFLFLGTRALILAFTNDIHPCITSPITTFFGAQAIWKKILEKLNIIKRVDGFQTATYSYSHSAIYAMIIFVAFVITVICICIFNYQK